MIDEPLLRAAHSSLCISWGTTAPFSVGKVRAERIGYARDRCVVVDVVTRQECVGDLVPIVRQRVFAELAERGWPNEEIEFTPRVQVNRRRKFTDENQSSLSHGRSKFGHAMRMTFDMRRELAEATFPPGSGSFAQLPDRRIT